MASSKQRAAPPAPVKGAPWRPLTRDGRLKFAPTFRNADEVVFAVRTAANLVALQRLRLADGHEERLLPEVAASQFDPSFSRDGRYLAYVRSSGNPQMVLVLADLQEQSEVLMKPASSRAVARDPEISPDGKQVAFTLSDDGGHHIAIVNVHGKGLKRLTPPGSIHASPAWSPDGQWIAFSSSRDGDFELYLMRPDGSEVRRLTHSPGLDIRPAWTPDGQQIAFTSNRDGAYAIYIMGRNGSNPRRLTETANRSDYPTWSPDGRSLLIVSRRHGRSDLYLLDWQFAKGVGRSGDTVEIRDGGAQ